MELAGATVLVTGASSGIGAATARLLAQEGATVGLVARRADRLAEVLADCRESTPASRHWVADLGDLDAAEHVALEAWDAFGHLDGVVHNAAIPKRRHATRLSYAEVQQVMTVNFLAPVRMTLALLPRMLERGTGTIVNVSSMGGRLGIGREAAYCASKFALCGWSESLYIDLHGTGVQVRLVEPGPIDTEIWDLPENEAPAYAGPKFPPEDCGRVILDALRGDGGFELFAPADFKAVVEYKTANIDTYLDGVAAFEASASPAEH